MVDITFHSVMKRRKRRSVNAFLAAHRPPYNYTLYRAAKICCFLRSASASINSPRWLAASFITPLTQRFRDPPPEPQHSSSWTRNKTISPLRSVITFHCCFRETRPSSIDGPYPAFNCHLLSNKRFFN